MMKFTTEEQKKEWLLKLPQGVIFPGYTNQRGTDLASLQMRRLGRRRLHH